MYADMNEFLHGMAAALPPVRQRLEQAAPAAGQFAQLPLPSYSLSVRSTGGNQPVAQLLSDLQQGDPAQRTRAAQELLALRGDEAVRQLQELALARDPALALYGVLILAEVRPALVVRELVGLASRNQPADDLRAYAWNRLAALQDGEAISELAASLVDWRDEAELEVTGRVLQAIGRRATAPLASAAQQLLRAQQWDAGRYAVYALLQIEPAAAVEGLRLLAQNDPDPAMRNEARKLMV